MKQIILLPIILGFSLAITGCRSDHAESGVQESTMPATASETNSTVSASNNSEPSQMQETDLQHSEPVVTEVQDTPSGADSPVIASTTQSVEISASDAADTQLETVPEDDDVEEDTGDFGELFS